MSRSRPLVGDLPASGVDLSADIFQIQGHTVIFDRPPLPDAAPEAAHGQSIRNISVEKDVTPQADRRAGRSRVRHSLNEYRLRRSGVDGMGNSRVRWANPYSGTFAYNPADPPRWAGPTSGHRNFQPRITIQHRRLFNPH